MTPIAQSELKPLNPKKARKYLNKKVVGLDGYVFDSKREARRYSELRLMELAGHITELKRQVAFVLAPAVRMGTAQRLKPALKLIVDFQYIDQVGKLVLEDTKGIITTAFRIKQHLLKDRYGMEVKVTK